MNINLGREILNKCQDLEVGVHGRSLHSNLRSNKERNVAEAERVVGNEIREVVGQMMLYFVDTIRH